MFETTGRLHLPCVKDGPLGGSARRAGEPSDDWSEIEALLAVPVRSHAAAVALPSARRQRTAPVILSSVVVTAAFGGILTGWWSLQRGCDAGAVGCAMTPAVSATVTPALPARSAPIKRVADAGAAGPDAGALPSVVEGRSVSEVSTTPEAPTKSATIDPAPAAATPASSTPVATPSPEASLAPAGDGKSESAPTTSVIPPAADRPRRASTHKRHNASR